MYCVAGVCNLPRCEFEKLKTTSQSTFKPACHVLVTKYVSNPVHASTFVSTFVFGSRETFSIGHYVCT